MVIKDGLGNTCWNFCNRPIVLFFLVKIVLIWMSKYNFESKYRPKCFWESALRTGMLLKNILGWIFLVVFLLKMTSWACFVGSGLKFIFHWKAHLFISCRSLLRLLAIFPGTLTVENRDVLSVNNLGLHWRLSDKSLMYIRNKSGLKLILQEHQRWSREKTYFAFPLNHIYCLAHMFLKHRFCQKNVFKCVCIFSIFFHLPKKLTQIKNLSCLNK